MIEFLLDVHLIELAYNWLIGVLGGFSNEIYCSVNVVTLPLELQVTTSPSTRPNQPVIPLRMNQSVLE